MAKKFKDYYDRDTAVLIAEKIQNCTHTFDSHSFVNYINERIKDAEFLQRQDVFVSAFDKYLDKNYPKNLETFTQILGPELQTETGMFIYGYWLWPVGRYIEKYATLDWKLSVEFIYELTKRFTGEFAIRPLLKTYPKKTMLLMCEWSKDSNVHVRRLSSEGVRLNLPWSKKLTVCLDEFDIYKDILWNLRADKSKFVQKSVGNNLNDLYKSHPEKALEIINSWKTGIQKKETTWIINHGLRSRRKKSKS